MYRFECKDLGMIQCNFSATGQTTDEVKNKAIQHAQQVHADMLKGMSPQQTEDFIKTVVSKIKSV